MDWFLIALIAPVLWSVDNHIDKHILGRYYNNVRPPTVMFLSALASGIFSLGIGLFYRHSLALPFADVLLILLGGVSILWLLFLISMP